MQHRYEYRYESLEALDGGKSLLNCSFFEACRKMWHNGWLRNGGFPKYGYPKPLIFPTDDNQFWMILGYPTILENLQIMNMVNGRNANYDPSVEPCYQ